MNQSFGKELQFLASAINKAAYKNKTAIFFKNINNHTKILSILADQGYIASYQILAGFIVVRLNVGNKKTPVVSIEKAARIGRSNLTTKLDYIKKMQQKNGGVSTLLLNTDKGVLTSTAAMEKGVGGKILFKLN